ncbi:MAG TPA: hypothetical protein VD813_02850 [Pseudonocardia sp.]|nr:hypothetical protein [Pseudonocardia sp.]
MAERSRRRPEPLMLVNPYAVHERPSRPMHVKAAAGTVVAAAGLVVLGAGAASADDGAETDGSAAFPVASNGVGPFAADDVFSDGPPAFETLDLADDLGSFRVDPEASQAWASLPASAFPSEESTFGAALTPETGTPTEQPDPVGLVTEAALGLSGNRGITASTLDPATLAVSGEPVTRTEVDLGDAAVTDAVAIAVGPPAHDLIATAVEATGTTGDTTTGTGSGTDSERTGTSGGGTTDPIPVTSGTGGDPTGAGTGTGVDTDGMGSDRRVLRDQPGTLVAAVLDPAVASDTWDTPFLDVAPAPTPPDTLTPSTPGETASTGENATTADQPPGPATTGEQTAPGATGAADIAVTDADLTDADLTDAVGLPTGPTTTVEPAGETGSIELATTPGADTRITDDVADSTGTPSDERPTQTIPGTGDQQFQLTDPATTQAIDQLITPVGDPELFDPTAPWVSPDEPATFGLTEVDPAGELLIPTGDTGIVDEPTPGRSAVGEQPVFSSSTEGQEDNVAPVYFRTRDAFPHEPKDPVQAAVVDHLNRNRSAVDRLLTSSYPISSPEDLSCAIADVCRQLRDLALGSGPLRPEAAVRFYPDWLGAPDEEITRQIADERERALRSPHGLQAVEIGCGLVCDRDAESGARTARVVGALIVGGDGYTYRDPAAYREIGETTEAFFFNHIHPARYTHGTTGLSWGDLNSAVAAADQINEGRDPSQFVTSGTASISLLEGTVTAASVEGDGNVDVQVLPGSPGPVSGQVWVGDGSEVEQARYPLPVDREPRAASVTRFAEGRKAGAPGFWDAQVAPRIRQFEQWAFLRSLSASTGGDLELEPSSGSTGENVADTSGDQVSAPAPGGSTGRVLVPGVGGIVATPSLPATDPADDGTSPQRTPSEQTPPVGTGGGGGGVVITPEVAPVDRETARRETVPGVEQAPEPKLPPVVGEPGRIDPAEFDPNREPDLVPVDPGLGSPNVFPGRDEEQERLLTGDVPGLFTFPPAPDEDLAQEPGTGALVTPNGELPLTPGASTTYSENGYDVTVTVVDPGTPAQNAGEARPGLLQQAGDAIDEYVLQPLGDAYRNLEEYNRRGLDTLMIGSQAEDGVLGFGVTSHIADFADGDRGRYDREGNLVEAITGSPPAKVPGWQLFNNALGGSRILPGNANAPGALPGGALKLRPGF